MPGKFKRFSKAWATVVVVALVVAIPFLYVLSYAPAVWLVAADLVTLESFFGFYRPLTWVCENCDAFRQFMNWYCGLWPPP